MSFDSSLILFPPGRGLPMSVGDLHRFCDHLRRELALKEKWLKVCLQYAQPGEPSLTMWDERGEMGTFTDELVFGETRWDYERENATWPQLLPGETHRNKLVEKAYVHFGNLPRESSEELIVRWPDGSATTYPYQVFLSLEPVVPMKLDYDDEDNRCFGSLRVSFFGGGYFSSRPLTKYWQAVRASPFLARALAACRAGLPGAALENVEGIKTQLGDLFLNRAEHEPGDWIVSVVETG